MIIFKETCNEIGRIMYKLTDIEREKGDVQTQLNFCFKGEFKFGSLS